MEFLAGFATCGIIWATLKGVRLYRAMHPKPAPAPAPAPVPLPAQSIASLGKTSHKKPAKRRR
jgi:hypothetical protein